MPTSSKSATETVQQPPVEKPLYAVLFQLEDVAVNGRKAAYETIKKLFTRSKADFTPELFARYCLNASPAVYLPQIAEALHSQVSSPEKMLEDFNQGVASSLAAQAVDPAFLKLLGAAKSRRFALVAVSALSESLAATISGRMGLDDLGVRLIPFQNGDKLVPGPTTWLKTAKGLELRPRCCLVITGAMSVCKSALSADMQCVVVPDELTAHQDFSGSNMVLESLSEFRPDELLGIIFPAQRR